MNQFISKGNKTGNIRRVLADNEEFLHKAHCLKYYFPQYLYVVNLLRVIVSEQLIHLKFTWI